MPTSALQGPDDSAADLRRARPSSFQRWLLAGNALAISILVAINAFLVSQDLDNHRERATLATQNLAQVLDQNIAALVGKTDFALQVTAYEMARQLARGRLDARSLDGFLARQQALLPEVSSLRVVDAGGVLRYGHEGASGASANVADRRYFLAARDHADPGLIIDGPLRSRITGQWIVVLSRRLAHSDGRFMGVVLAAIGVEHFQRLFTGTNLGPGSAITLRTTDLRLITRHPDAPEFVAGIGQDHVSAQLKEILSSHPDGGNFIGTNPVDRIERLCTYSRVGKYPLYIVVGTATKAYFDEWMDEAFRVTALTAVVILVMVLSSRMLYRSWRQQRLAAESLRASAAHLRLMVEGVRDYAVFTLDPQGLVATWNEGAERLTGHQAADIVGQHVSRLYPAPKVAKEEPAEALLRAEQERSFESESWRVRKDGTLFMAHVVITAVTDSSGQRRGFTIILRDVTDQRLAEQAAKKANSLLQEAVNSIAIGFCIFDPDDRLVICNEAYRDFHGRCRDHLVPGAKFEDLVRHGLGLFPHQADEEDIEARVQERLLRHRAADAIPMEHELDDGRRVLMVEYRTPSGHVVGNCMDVTELYRHRHHLEQLVEARTAEVQASMAQFRILIEQAPTAMAMLGPDLDYLAVSRRWMEEFGGGHRHLIGQNLFEVHPYMPDSWKATFRAALAGTTLRKDEDLWTHADGKRHWLRWAVYPWTDEKGGIGGIIISAEDITDRKQAKEELRASEVRFRSTFEQAAVGLAHVDLDGRWLRVNEKLCTIVGFEREELLGRSFQDITHPEDLEANLSGRTQLLDGTLSCYQVEKRYVRKDGGVVWINLTVSLALGEQGQPDYFIAVIEDIQRRKEAEFALAEEREMFRSLSLIASDYFWEMDEQFRITAVSESIFFRTGLCPQAYLGKSWWDFPHLGLGEAEREAHRATLDARRPFRHHEVGLLNTQGEECWFSISGDPVFSKTGEFKGYRGATQDITERKANEMLLESYQKRLEQQVAERTADLKAANRELQGFTYAASHDLKAPLGRINSFSTLLERNYRDRLEGDGLLFLDLIRRNATRMTALIEDLLAHAQIEQKILNLQAVDLRRAVQSALREREGEIGQAAVEIRLDLPAATVFASPHGLDQVLNNLLENALKYSAQSNPPIIEIGGRVQDRCCRLWIRDNGVGFDMAYHDRIFEIFQRLHTYEEFPGSGVGLALVRKAMERMGGKVWADSAPGQGATFYLELPV